jgi:putative acetyltransferase
MKPQEAVQTAKVLHRSAEAAYRHINWDYGENQTVSWFTSNLDQWESIWTCLMGDQVCGVLCLQPGFVDQLFIDVKWQGKGLGTVLLDRAKLVYPEGFWLYVFQKNTQAIAFYEKHGLIQGEAGVSLAEGEKDFKYHWRP